MVLVLTWGRESGNGEAAIASGGRLGSSAAEELRSQTSDLRDLALNGLAAVTDATDEAAKSKDDPSHQSGQNFDRLFLVDMKTNSALAVGPRFGSPQDYLPLSPGLKRLIRRAGTEPLDLLRGAIGDGDLAAKTPDVTSAGAGESGFVAANNRGYTASIVPLEFSRNPWFASAGNSAGPIALVGLRLVSSELLDNIARRAGIGTLDLVFQPNNDAAFAAMPLNVDQKIFLQWQPDRPGDRNFRVVGSMLVSFAALFAGLVAYRSTMQLAESEARAIKMAGHDLLSGAANRMLFTQVLDGEIAKVGRRSSRFALFYVDIDHFKEINDTYGHDTGDRIIIAATKRMDSMLRAGDKLARFGGDEFSILQANVQTKEDSEALATRLIEGMREPFEIDGHHVFAWVSIGFATCPFDSSERGQLMRFADIALYRAKREGRNRFVSFEPPMFEELRQKKASEEELRHAIEHDQLTVAYQPILAMDGKTVVSVEALARWKHPSHGMVPTEDFIKVAEDQGLILQLGEWMLRQACRDAVEWDGIHVSVNVSPTQFRHPNFVAGIERVLRETGLDPHRLELELTEGVVITNATRAKAAMADLHALGVRLALDNFGTGYSSLMYLRRFAFDKIKIAQSFIDSIESDSEGAVLLESVVHLGRALGLTVTAKGVENLAQYRFLQGIGCTEVQGYFFAKPMPADDVMRVIAASPAITEPSLLSKAG